MFSIQIAYKKTGEEKDLLFQIIRNCETISGAVKVFEEAFPGVIIYSILRCGKT